MNYSNPKIPEGINAKRENPLKEFAILLGGVLVTMLLVLVALGLAADQLTRYIPFSYELALAESIEDYFPESSEENKAYSAELTRLADALISNMDIPEDIKITVHYVDDDTVNAFATLGGHVFMHRGLLEKLHSENALAMVLSHEIAHIKHRHPVRGLGRGLVVMMSMAALAGVSGDTLVNSVLGNAGIVGLLKFTRDQETESDESGLAAVVGHYGHTSGALDLYRVFLELEGDSGSTASQFFSTHPFTPERIERLEQLSRDEGWSNEGLVEPMVLEF